MHTGLLIVNLYLYVYVMYVYIVYMYVEVYLPIV